MKRLGKAAARKIIKWAQKSSHHTQGSNDGTVTEEGASD